MSTRIVKGAFVFAVVVAIAPAISPAADYPSLSPQLVRFASRYVASGHTKLVNECNGKLDEAKQKEYPEQRRDKFKEAYNCFNNALILLQDGNRRLVKDSLGTDANVLSTTEKSLVPDAQSVLDTDQQNANTGKNAADQGQSQSQNQVNFMGWNFGLGLGYMWGTGQKRVTASVVNNIVRVSSDVTDGGRVIGESHYFFENKKGTYGIGPFAAIETGSSNGTNTTGLTGFGVGGMIGMQVDPKSSSGLNLGLGYMWEPNVQTLGDGIKANQALPTGETQVRYKNQSEGGVILFFSWKFGSSAPTQSSSTSNTGS